MGLGHKKLTYFYHGLEERLTGQRGNLIQKVLAERRVTASQS